MITDKPATRYMVALDRQEVGALWCYQVTIEHHEIPQLYYGGCTAEEVIHTAIANHQLDGRYDLRARVYDYCEIGAHTTVYLMDTGERQ